MGYSGAIALPGASAMYPRASPIADAHHGAPNVCDVDDHSRRKAWKVAETSGNLECRKTSMAMRLCAFCGPFSWKRLLPQNHFACKGSGIRVPTSPPLKNARFLKGFRRFCFCGKTNQGALTDISLAVATFRRPKLWIKPATCATCKGPGLTPVSTTKDV